MIGLIPWFDFVPILPLLGAIILFGNSSPQRARTICLWISTVTVRQSMKLPLLKSETFITIGDYSPNSLIDPSKIQTSMASSLRNWSSSRNHS